MIPVFPIVELIDRYAISVVKLRRTDNGNLDEYNFYNHQIINYNTALVQNEIDALITIHDQIWDLEKELKSGKEHLLSLEEIGRRAIAIRDANHKRIELKNHIAEALGCSVREIKKDHLSE